jgi:hypothetical protein
MNPPDTPLLSNEKDDFRYFKATFCITKWIHLCYEKIDSFPASTLDY